MSPLPKVLLINSSSVKTNLFSLNPVQQQRDKQGPGLLSDGTNLRHMRLIRNVLSKKWQLKFYIYFMFYFWKNS